MSEQLEILKDFPLKIQIPIAWIDMDIYCHVNNANYFRYFESARIKYFESIGLYERYKTDGIAGVLSNTSCNYMIPLKYPDIIKVGMRVVEVESNVIKMEHYISNSKNDLVAFGESEVVIFDFINLKKIDIPLFLKNEIERFENKSF